MSPPLVQNIPSVSKTRVTLIYEIHVLSMNHNVEPAKRHGTADFHFAQAGIRLPLILALSQLIGKLVL